MGWITGEPPRNGRQYVCESPDHAGPLFLRWVKYNGLAAWRDWDNDAHSAVLRWHPLDP